jgi:hypothetical protein
MFAETLIVAVTYGMLFLGGTAVNNEPHWSFRDGCSVQSVKAEGGGYSYASYDHCKSLPRVYSGKEWKPTESRGNTV